VIVTCTLTDPATPLEFFTQCLDAIERDTPIEFTVTPDPDDARRASRTLRMTIRQIFPINSWSSPNDDEFSTTLGLSPDNVIAAGVRVGDDRSGDTIRVRTLGTSAPTTCSIVGADNQDTG
jgi:hypothetical protein